MDVRQGIRSTFSSGESESAVDLRELKGLELAARARIVFSEGAWLVPSQSGNGKYRVVLQSDGDTCTCDDFTLTGRPCKHVHAARLARERDHGGKSPAIDTSVVPVKKSYSQNWPLYNEAATTEKDRFQALLFDLCSGIPQPPREKKRGRPACPVADAIFAAAFKVYSTVSTRRFACDLKDAHAKGYTSRSLHYNSVCTYLEDSELTPVLRELIAVSSLPLRAVETDFAVDSSGFSTSRFVRWYDQKYGVTRESHDWVKVHILTGVKTNIITAVEIHGRDAGDCPQFKPLVEATAKHFKIGEGSADKAYVSAENVEAVAALGGTAFIAFKANSTGAKGGLFEKMFHYFQFRREEFLQHYHKRSNVESTFSMIKAKFRDHVRSRTDAAMVNEALCKILCHNIVVVHQSHIELGIEPVFWPEKPKGGPDVLPLTRPG